MQINMIGVQEQDKEQSIFGNVSNYDVSKINNKGFEDTVSKAAVLEHDNNQKSDYKEPVVAADRIKPENEAEAVAKAIDTMSSAVTPADYKLMQEMGFAPDEDDPDTVVTVTERIKIELATYCDDYNVTGNIDMDKLEKMYGNSGMAYTVAKQMEQHDVPVTESNAEDVKETLDMAKSLTAISDGSMDYILRNDLTVSVGNVYTSQHANADAFAAETKMTDVQWQSIEPQVKQLLQNSGMNMDEQMLTNARWMMENKIPVTVQNLEKMSDMQAFTGEMTDEQWTESIIATIEAGMDSKDTLVQGYEQMSESVQEFMDKVAAMDEDVETTTANVTDIEQIKAKRQIEEIRLMMTVKAGIKMMTKGMYLNTSELQKVVEELKSQEQKYTDAVFGSIKHKPTVDESELFNDTRVAMEELKKVPAYVIGNVVSKSVSFEVNAVNERGQSLKTDLEQAKEKYETMMTQPRKDLGDSIKKAFNNVGNILSDMGIDATAANERAVRILAYNQMEINEDSINNIKAVDMEVNTLIDNMTPKTTAYLIAKGINPLNTNISELNEKLSDINNEIGADNTKKYSEFLWELDHQKAISEEDREAYIGMYRLINMVEKGDRSAVGALVNAGAEVTLNNLLHAVRSEKSEGMDRKIDDSTGFADEITKAGSISEQLAGFEQQQNNDENGDNQAKQKYYEQIMEMLQKEISPSKLDSVDDKESLYNMDIEELLEYVREQPEENMADKMQHYEERTMEFVRAAQTISEDVLRMLMDSSVAPTVANAVTAQYMMNDNGRIFGKMKSLFEEDELDAALDDIEDFSDADKVNDAYEKIDTLVSDNVEKMMLSGKYQDINELVNIRKQIHMMNVFKEKSSYNVPIEIDGETSSVRVTLVSDKENAGKVSANIFSEIFGRITAEFSVKGVNVDGTISADSESTVSFIEQNIAALENSFAENGFICEKFKSYEDSSTHRYFDKTDNKTKNSELFRVAKIFIANVKEWGNELSKQEKISDK